MRTESATQKIIRVVYVRHPIAQRFVDCILQRACASIHGNYFSPEQPHSKNIERLASHIFCAHVDDALQAKHRANRRRRDAVLTCTCFGNYSVSAHSPREQRLPHRVVDLVCASVQEIFPLQIDLRSAGVRSESLRGKQRRWSAAVITQKLLKFAPESLVVSRTCELCRQLLQRRYQSFRNI